MELTSELLRAFASFAVGQGFTTAVWGEAQRPLQLGRQRIHLDVRPRRGAWDVHLVVRTSFLLDPEHDEYACSFRTTAHRLDSRWPSHWRLKEGNWTVVSEQLQQAYGETLGPFSNRTQTPAGMVQWLCKEYEPLRLLSPSFVEPLRRGLALVEVLPQEAQVVGQSLAFGRTKGIARFAMIGSVRTGQKISLFGGVNSGRRTWPRLFFLELPLNIFRQLLAKRACPQRAVLIP